MPQTLTPGETQFATALRQQNRKRWTRQDCELLERIGLLTERYELIDGEIVVTVGQNTAHAFSVMQAILWLAGVFGGESVLTQASVEVDATDRPTNRPEPDVFVLNRPAFDYIPNRPAASDTRLIVEVAETTQHDDLRIKPGLYARAGVPEYWVLDVPSRRLIVHRQPANGAYTHVFAYREDETVAPLAAPDSEVRIADLLPPVQAVDSGSSGS